MTDRNPIKSPASMGDIPSAIAKASSLNWALMEGARFVAERTGACACIYWAYNAADGDATGDAAGDNMLHPVFCVGPEDVTAKSVARGEGIVGRVFDTQKIETQFAFDPASDPATQEPFEHIVIQSVVCVPVTERVGCIQLINKNDGSLLTQDDADLLNSIVTFATTTLAAGSEERNVPALHRDQPIIVASGIKREYQNGDRVTKVLQGVNLNVYKGEFLAVLGESGCGKSTFLNIIGGMDQADSGSFTFEGREFSHASQSELTRYRRDNIGFVFQSYNLMPNLTALQNLQLIAELVDNPMDCREALKLVKLGHRMDQYPSQLSGGEQQRVSIARALVKNPKIIFADEPTAALDYATSIEVLQVLGNVLDLGTTLVMVTHNQEITRMANRVVRLRRGKTYEIMVNSNPVDATALVW